MSKDWWTGFRFGLYEQCYVLFSHSNGYSSRRQSIRVALLMSQMGTVSGPCFFYKLMSRDTPRGVSLLTNFATKIISEFEKKTIRHQYI